jgi:hypothetical protein
VELDELHEHRELLPWSPAGIELMMRASIVHAGNHERVRHWAVLTQQVVLHETWTPGSKRRLMELVGSNAILSRAEWADVERARRSGDEIVDRAAVVMLRSSLRWAEAKQRESIVHWTRRVRRDGV